jgi:hypothetical protein
MISMHQDVSTSTHGCIILPMTHSGSCMINILSLFCKYSLLILSFSTISVSILLRYIYIYIGDWVYPSILSGLGEYLNILGFRYLTCPCSYAHSRSLLNAGLPCPSGHFDSRVNLLSPYTSHHHEPWPIPIRWFVIVTLSHTQSF